MAAPVVSGTVALMLQANPTLTPNQVKAILEYTAEAHPNYDPLTEGAGFLNAKGAVELAQALATPSPDRHATPLEWSGRLIWGNQVVAGGRLVADANAWGADVIWGTKTTPIGESVVWGTTCDGADCDGQWRIDVANAEQSVVWGTADDESVVWGTVDDESVVWGTSCSDPTCEPVIWPKP
jgi:serine protease AprX